MADPRIVEVRASLESDRSLLSYDAALAHVTGPRLTNNVQVYWNQVMLDVLFEYPIRSDQSRFSIHPGLARLGLDVITARRVLPPNGAVRAFEFVGDPGRARLDPRWDQPSLQLLKHGSRH